MKLYGKTTSLEKIKEIIETEKAKGYIMKIIPDPYAHPKHTEIELQFLFLNKNHEPVSKRYFLKKLTWNTTGEIYRMSDIVGKREEW